jgi:hypothetical protein
VCVYVHLCVRVCVSMCVCLYTGICGGGDALVIDCFIRWLISDQDNIAGWV